MNNKIQIIQSPTEPMTHELWLHDGDLKRFDGKGWVSIIPDIPEHEDIKYAIKELEESVNKDRQRDLYTKLAINYRLNNPDTASSTWLYFVPWYPNQIQTSITATPSATTLSIPFLPKSVTSLENLFKDDSLIVDLDLSGWDISGNTSMKSIFQNCSSLENVNLNNWDVSSITYFNNAFRGCNKLKEADLSFWDTKSVTSTSGMFQQCYALKDVKGQFNTTDITDMSNMFLQCYELEYIQGIENWDTTNLKNLNYAFCMVPKFRNIRALRNWNVSNVTNMTQTFAGNQTSSGVTLRSFYSNEDLEYALSDWDVSKVSGSITSLFGACVNIINLDFLKKWNITNKVTSIYGIFSLCFNLKDITGISHWDVSKVTDMRVAFQYCAMPNVDCLENWHPTNLKKVDMMFEVCDYIEDTWGIRNWNMSNVTSASEMFDRCPNLKTLYCNWDLGNCTDFLNCFYKDYNLTDIIGSLRNIKADISFKESPLNRESALVVINGLASVSTTKQLALSEYTKSLLKPEDIAIITTKNWSLI